MKTKSITNVTTKEKILYIIFNFVSDSTYKILGELFKTNKNLQIGLKFNIFLSVY